MAEQEVLASFMEDAIDTQAGEFSLAALLTSFGAYHFFTRGETGMFASSDVRYVIEAHLPQGHDRAIFSARSVQHLANDAIMAALQIPEIRKRAANMGKAGADEAAVAQAKSLRQFHMSQLLRAELASVLVGAHVHAALLTMHVMENTAFVLVHLQEALITKAIHRTTSSGAGRAALSSLRAWWANGVKHQVMQMLMSCMSSPIESSPFTLKDETDVDSPRLPSMRASASPERPPFDVLGGSDVKAHSAAGAVADKSTPAIGSRCFPSVEELITAIIPQLVGDVLERVDTTLAKGDLSRFNINGTVSGADIREALAEFTEGLDTQICWWTYVARAFAEVRHVPGHRNVVSTLRDAAVADQACDDSRQWVVNMSGSERVDEASSESAGPSTSDGAADCNDDSELEEEIMRVARHRQDLEALVAVHGPVPDTGDFDTAAFDGALGTAISGTEGSAGTSYGAAAVERASAEHAVLLQRVQAAKLKRVHSFFSDLIHSISFSELSLAYAREILLELMDEAGNFKAVKTYNPNTDSAATPMIIAHIDKIRQNVFLQDFVVKSYVQLFCAQTINATCRTMV